MNAVIFYKNAEKLEIIILEDCSIYTLLAFIANTQRHYASEAVFLTTEKRINVDVSLKNIPRLIEVVLGVSETDEVATLKFMKAVNYSAPKISQFENPNMYKSISAYRFKPQNVSLRKLGPETFSPSVKDLIKKHLKA